MRHVVMGLAMLTATLYGASVLAQDYPPPPPDGNEQPPLPPIDFAEGSLLRVKNDARVWHIMQSKRHWIPNTAVLKHYGLQGKRITTITTTQLIQVPRAKLLRAKNTTGVFYITETGKKRPVINELVLMSYPGNSFDDIIEVDQLELDAIADNVLIRVENRDEVWKIENNIIRHITSPEVLFRLGYGFGDVAPINLTEFSYYVQAEDIN